MPTSNFSDMSMLDKIAALTKGGLLQFKHWNEASGHGAVPERQLRELRAAEYGLPRERINRNPMDKAVNYAGGYDWGARESVPLEDALDMAKAYQLWDYMTTFDPRREADAQKDYEENVAGVMAAQPYRGIQRPERDMLREAAEYGKRGYASGGEVGYNEFRPAQLPGALFDPVPEGMSDEGSNKILSALKQIQLNGSLAIGKNQYSDEIGYGGRIGYGAPLGDDGFLSAGISGQGHRANVRDVGTFANSNITGGDISYSTPKHSLSARFDLQGMSPSTMLVGPYSAADAVMSRTPFIPPDQMPVPNRNAFQVNYRRNFAMGGAVFPAAVSPLATIGKRNA